MTITNIYSDSTGESRFRDLSIGLLPQGMIGLLSNPVTVQTLVFREVEPNYDWDFHNAPERQFVVLLDGEIEIKTSLGEKRVFKAGDILLVEDVAGKGHRTRNITLTRRRSLFITLPSTEKKYYQNEDNPFS